MLVTSNERSDSTQPPDAAEVRRRGLYVGVSPRIRRRVPMHGAPPASTAPASCNRRVRLNPSAGASFPFDAPAFSPSARVGGRRRQRDGSQ